MKVWREIKISKLDEVIMIELYRYRLVTNELLAIKICGHLSSSIETQKTNISKRVKKLRDKGLIDSENYGKELIHSLTKKGVAFVKEHVKVDAEDPLAGFNDIFGDFTSEQLSNCKKNIGHHLMFVRFAIEESKKNRHVRHNLYASRSYFTKKLRPDGELFLPKSGLMYAIEIDTGSMRTEQLVTKFQNYESFIYWCEQNNQPLPWIGVLFVTKRRDVPLHQNQRFKSILQAATQGLGSFCWTFDVCVGNYSLKSLLFNNQELLNKYDISIPVRSSMPPILQKKAVEKNSVQLKELEAVKNKQDTMEERRQKKYKEEDQKVKEELNQEALTKWNGLPEKERTIKVGSKFGFFGNRVENIEKKKQFIHKYIESNFDDRLKKEYGSRPFLFFDD